MDIGTRDEFLIRLSEAIGSVTDCAPDAGGCRRTARCWEDDARR